MNTLSITLNISPRNGIGIGPGIPIRRKTLFVYRLYLRIFRSSISLENY